MCRGFDYFSKPLDTGILGEKDESRLIKLYGKGWCCK